MTKRMSSASHPKGLAIARELIAREAEAQTGFLDLGGLGLKAMPEELRRLARLRGVNWRGLSKCAGIEHMLADAL